MGEPIEVFVVGDSWAALAGNSSYQSSDTLPDGLGSVPVGHDVLRAALTNAPTPSGEARFTIKGYHSWAIPGTTADGWLSGDPCATFSAAEFCGTIPIAARPGFTQHLLQQISSVPADRTPLVYLSLGANDLIDAGQWSPVGRSLDLTDQPAVDAVMAQLTSDLIAVLTQITEANPRTNVLKGHLHSQLVCVEQPAEPGPTRGPGVQTPLRRRAVRHTS